MGDVTERESLIRAAYDGLSHGDVDAVMRMCHDDVVWDWTRSLAPFAGVYHGREGLQELYRSFMLVATSLVLTVEDAEPLAEHVIIHVKVDVRSVSGTEGSARSPHLLTFDGDLVRRHTLFQERAEAIAYVTERASRAGRTA